MSEEEVKQNINTNPEILAPEETKSSPTESVEDQNWKLFREQRKKEREEKLAAERKLQEKEQEVAALKAAVEAALSRNTIPQQNNYFNEIEESEEQRLEKKIAAILAMKEEQRRREEAEREQREYPTKLAKDYPDISSVCSSDNLDYLDYHYPEISRTFQRLPDGYDKWRDIYQAVKRLVPNTNAKKDAAKIDQNLSKPKSMSSSTISPEGEKMSYSWQDMEKRRAENWARMQRMLKSGQ